MPARGCSPGGAIRYHNQRDELVAIQDFPIIRAEREAAKSRGKNTKLETATYTDEDIAQIDRELEQEVPRGATPRYWEDTRSASGSTPWSRGR